MEKVTATARITNKIFEILKKNPEGVRWSELLRQIKSAEPDLHPKTINGTVWKLLEKHPEQVYKPEKGLFRLTKFK